MKYSDGQEIIKGDRVQLGDDKGGIVVGSIDRDEYSDNHPKEKWSYLGKGVVIEFPRYGLIHYEEPEVDLKLISRGELE
jgi:hypothetical protein